MAAISIEFDSLVDIDAAVHAVTYSMTQEITRLPPRVAVSATVILRALKVYRAIVEHDNKRKATP